MEGNKMVPYKQPEKPSHGLRAKGTSSQDDLDNRESIASFIDDLANDPKSKDGIPRGMFPLSTEELPAYKFSVKGETTIKGRRAFDLIFQPIEHKVCIDVGAEDSGFRVRAEIGSETHPGNAAMCRPWKGEVWVDAEDYQPIRIDTTLAKGIPWGVRVFMGIDIKQLGFSLSYERVAPGVWFPASYGTEFRIVVFWGYKRTITLSMENTDFKKTDAQSTVRFESTEQ
jgi:hypothetical protein